MLKNSQTEEPQPEATLISGWSRPARNSRFALAVRAPPLPSRAGGLTLRPRLASELAPFTYKVKPCSSCFSRSCRGSFLSRAFRILEPKTRLVAGDGRQADAPAQPSRGRLTGSSAAAAPSARRASRRSRSPWPRVTGACKAKPDERLPIPVRYLGAAGGGAAGSPREPLPLPPVPYRAVGPSQARRSCLRARPAAAAAAACWAVALVTAAARGLAR